MRHFIAAALLAVSVPASSHAADYIIAPLPPVENASFSWEGGYVGLQGGVDITNGSVQTPAIGRVNGNTKIGVFGVFGGWNMAVTDHIVAGVEANADYNLSTDVVGGANGALQGRARLGYAFDKTLVYVSAGYGVDWIDYNDRGLTARTLNGGVYGAGIDYALTDNVFTRLDYRFKNYKGDLKQAGQKVGSMTSNQHVISVGLGYKF